MCFMTLHDDTFNKDDCIFLNVEEISYEELASASEKLHEDMEKLCEENIYLKKKIYYLENYIENLEN